MKIEIREKEKKVLPITFSICERSRKSISGTNTGRNAKRYGINLGKIPVFERPAWRFQYDDVVQSRTGKITITDNTVSFGHVEEPNYR